MYQNTTACVKLPLGLTDTFNINLGIRQGDCLSPILFNLFINDISSIFTNDCNPVALGQCNVNYLLFADDLLMLSESASGLQHSLNNLDSYAKKWCLDINTKKTKVLVFQRFGRKPEVNFKFGSNKVETAKTYTYLGVTFDGNCNFKSAANDLKIKGTKASFKLSSALSSLNHINVKTHTKLFDALIRPIISYGCEVWLPDLFYKESCPISKKLDTITCEKVHNSFCKRILNIYKSSPNALARQELGRLPLLAFTSLQIVKYWSHILEKPRDSILYQAYLSEVEYDSKWIRFVKYFLNLYKLNNHWQTQTPINKKTN